MPETNTLIGGRKVIILGDFEQPERLASMLASIITGGNALEWCEKIGALRWEVK